MFIAVRVTNAMGYAGWMVRDVTTAAAYTPGNPRPVAACVAGTFAATRVAALVKVAALSR